MEQDTEKERETAVMWMVMGEGLDRIRSSLAKNNNNNNDNATYQVTCEIVRPQM